MTRDRIRNMAASVRQRLLNYAREHDEEFQYVLGRYARERFLQRLGRSVHADRFVVKGAVLFLVWGGAMHRLTKDLDLLGFGSTEAADLEQVVREICTTEAPDDGIVFRADTVRSKPIREDQEYEGVRILLHAYLGTARVPLQVDVGFGDVVTPPARHVVFPTMLDFEAPRLRVYPRETVVAEKFHALVDLGIGTSRMKDFYDLWFLAREYSFEGARLVEAMRRTFERRQTVLPAQVPVTLTSAFAADAAKQRQWSAFLRKGRLRTGAVALEDVIPVLEAFLAAPSMAATRQEVFKQRWVPGGPWAPETE